MGFYGNIKNTSRTQFSFDKVYASRVEMDNACPNDGVYAGRYVLVEYEQNFNVDNFPIGYLKDGVLYAGIPTTANGTTLPYRLQKSVDPDNPDYSEYPAVFVKPGTVIHVPKELNFDEDWDEVGGVKKPSSCFYVIKKVEAEKENVPTYIINPETLQLTPNVNDEGEPIVFETLLHATFVKLSSVTVDNVGQDIGVQLSYDNFITNFSIDRNTYGAARGYDSTVWQKVYTGSASKYVMVAELNSVVPTFDIAADAPTTTPILPHFDADSTNIYYRLHLQPQWGFRVKSSDPTLKTPVLNSRGESTYDFIETRADVREYPSDQTTNWKNLTYNAISGEADEFVFVTNDGNENPAWVKAIDVIEDRDEIGAAIYFNKAGFDPANISYSGDKFYKDWSETGYQVKDEIAITPTGRSGHRYNPHNGVDTLATLPDTQELSVMLPSIGDTMAQIWDLIYGGRNLDPDAKTRKLDTKWYNAKAVSNKDAVRMVNTLGPGRYTYDKKASGTVAGILNSAQDLMGMIITDEVPDVPSDANDQYIYYDSNKQNYFFKHKTYRFEEKTFPNNRIPDNYEEYEKVDIKKWESEYFYVDTATKSGYEFILEDTFYPERKYIRTPIVKAAMIPIGLSAEYKPNGEFFYKSSDVYPPVNGIPGATYNYFVASYEEYNPQTRYYTLKPSPDDVQLKANEAIYIPNTYYYITYLPVALTNVTYEPGVYYYISYIDNTGNPHYVLAEGETIESNLDANNNIVQTYYKRTYTLETSLQKRDLVYYRVLPNSGQNSNAYYKQNKRALDAGDLSYNDYSPNNYYYKVDSLDDVPPGAEFELINTTVYVRDDATYASAEDYESVGHDYYTIQIEYELVQGQDVIEITDENAVMVENMRDMTEFKLENRGIFYIYVDSEGASRYIEVNYNNFAKAYNASTKNYEFIIMDFVVVGKPYHANNYYYEVLDDNTGKAGSFLIDDREEITEGRQYYRFEPQPDIDYTGNILNENYFVKGKFFKEEPMGSGIYVEINSYEEYIANNQIPVYNNISQLYVISDDENIYQKGAVWPMEVKQIPVGVKLGTREDDWELAPLKGFADKITTLHGMILRLYKHLNDEDVLTRDSNLAQGALNLFNDLLDKFSTLKPGQFTIVDDYGRMHSAKHSTSQAITYSNGLNAQPARENALLTLSVNSDFKNPSWSIVHSDANITDNTTSNFNMNTPNEVNTIDLYTPITDNAGHVVGKNTHTVTLPYGWKKVTPLNSPAINVDVDENETQIIATVTQDNFNIASQNKWLKLAGEGKTIKIAHSLVSSTFGEQKSNSQDSTPKFGDTFNVPVITVDNAGHTTAFTTETVRIPGLTFTNDDGTTNDVVLNMSYRYDTDTDTGIFTEERGHVDLLTIQDYNITNGANAKLANTDKIHQAFEKLQAQIDAMDLVKVGGAAGEYITDITEVDGVVTANKSILPTVADAAVEGEFVNEVSQSLGKITTKRTPIVPTVTIGAGTADNAPTVNITINSKSATAQALTIATTGVYGVTKLTNDYAADGTSLAVTGLAIKNAFDTLKVDGNANIAASQTIKSWKEEAGKVTIETQEILIKNSNVADDAAIAISKIDGLQAALDSKEPTIPDETYDTFGSADQVKKDLTGAEDDAKDKLTLYGLRAYSKEIEGQTGDTKDKLTINGLATYISEVETSVNNVKGKESDTEAELTIYGLLAYIKKLEGQIETLNGLVEGYHPSEPEPEEPEVPDPENPTT